MQFRINESMFLHQNEGPDGFYEKTKNEYNDKICTTYTCERLYMVINPTRSVWFFFL